MNNIISRYNVICEILNFRIILYFKEVPTNLLVTNSSRLGCGDLFKLLISFFLEDKLIIYLVFKKNLNIYIIINYMFSVQATASVSAPTETAASALLYKLTV